jgi:hypothetical protein
MSDKAPRKGQEELKFVVKRSQTKVAESHKHKFIIDKKYGIEKMSRRSFTLVYLLL